MKTILLFLVFITFTSSAFASLLIEPYAGSTYGAKAKINGTKEDATGTALGGRLGYANYGFMFGLNLTQFEITPETTSPKIKATTYGLFLGYNTPFMIRLFGEFLLNGDGEYEEDKISKVTGSKFGVGFINLEYISINFELINQTISFEGTREAWKHEGALVSLSIPITI